MKSLAALLFLILTATPSFGQELHWYEGQTKKTAVVAEDEAVENLRSSGIYPVLYRGGRKSPATRLVLTDEIVLRFPSSCTDRHREHMESRYGLELIRPFPFVHNAYLYRAKRGDPLEALNAANSLYESGEVLYSYPNMIKHFNTRSQETRQTPNDPLYPKQWTLHNTGQNGGTPGEDARVEQVWDRYKGTHNEIIAVVDDGVEINHPDLRDNVIAGLSYDFVNGDNDPSPDTPGSSHGTEAAGVAAARGFNGIGVSGAAPRAGLVGYRLLYNTTDVNVASALTLHGDVVDVYTNSWGPEDNGDTLEGPGPLTLDFMKAGITYGRGGLGLIYVWAAGNGGKYGDNVNYDGYANSRYTIAVGASDNFGKRPSYTEKGAPLIVNAPSSGGSMDVTTTNYDGYTQNYSGTSAAAPLVAGVIALMLEANPRLAWRDVRDILIHTAYHNDPNDPGWTTNGAGYAIHYYYGFGRVDALSAVEKARSWQSSGPELMTEATSTPGLPIADNHQAGGVIDSVTIADDLSVEYVEVVFTSDHECWGDLGITLVSPWGSQSELAVPHATSCAARFDYWTFGSARHFGESSKGIWALQVKDGVSKYSGTLNSWTLKVYGTKRGSAVPAAVLKANGESGRVTLKSGKMLRVTASLDSGAQQGENANWLLSAETPPGRYYYDALRSAWLAGSALSYQGPLFALPETQVLAIDNLPKGVYTFTFGVESRAFYGTTLTVTVEE